MRHGAELETVPAQWVLGFEFSIVTRMLKGVGNGDRAGGGAECAGKGGGRSVKRSAVVCSKNNTNTNTNKEKTDQQQQINRVEHNISISLPMVVLRSRQ
jgi:hypothetical protein